MSETAIEQLGPEEPAEHAPDLGPEEPADDQMGVSPLPGPAVHQAATEGPEADAFRQETVRGLGASGRMYDPANGARVREIARDASLAAFKARTTTLTPDQGAEALDHAASTGLGPIFVAGNLDAVREQAEQAKLKATLTAAPVTASFAAQTPAHAAMVKDDADPLSLMEWVFGRYQSFPGPQPGAVGPYALQQTSHQEMTIPPAWISYYAKGIEGLKAAALGIQEGLQPRFGPDGKPIERPAGEQATAQAEIRDAQELAAAPVPGTEGHLGREMVGASVEAVPQMVGLIAAGTPFLIAQTYGQLHNHFSAQTKDDGTPKYTEEQARALSLGGATATGVILGGVAKKFAASTIGKLLPNATQDAIGKAASTGIVEKLAQSPALFDNLVARGLQFKDAMIHGLAFMVGQSVIDDLTKQAGDMLTGGKFDSGKTRLAVEQAVDSAFMLLPLTAIGPVRSVIEDTGRAWKAHTDAADVATQSEAAKASKTIKRSPEQSQTLIKAQSEQDPSRSTGYIPVAAFDKTMAEAGVDPAAAAADLTGDDGAHTEATASGGDVAIPMAAVLTKLAPEGHTDALLPDLKLDPSAMSLREAQPISTLLAQREVIKQQPESPERTAALADNYRAMAQAAFNEPIQPSGGPGTGTPEATPKPTEDAVYHDFFAKVAGYPGASEAARLYAAGINRLAEGAGIAPEEMAARFPFNIGGQAEGVSLQQRGEIRAILASLPGGATLADLRAALEAGAAETPGVPQIGSVRELIAHLPADATMEDVRASVEGTGERDVLKLAQDAVKNLLAMHNLTAENLVHADELGGLVAPSMAVSRSEFPLDNFGEITLIGAPDLIDPSKTPVFNADVYSPRWPSSRFKMKEKETRAFLKEIQPHAKKLGTYLSDIENEFSKDGIEGVLSRKQWEATLGSAFLEEKGQPAEPIMRPARLEKGSFFEGSALRDFFEKHGRDVNFEHDSEYHREMSKAALRALDEYAEKVNKANPDDPTFGTDIADSIKEKDFTDGRLDFSDATALVRDAERVGKTEVDRSATEDDVLHRLNADPALKAEFTAWAKAKLGALFGDRYIEKYTDQGNRRKLPYTAENLLRELVRQIRQGDGFNYGPGSARALGAKRFRSLEGLKAERNRIVSHEEMERAKEQLDSKMMALAEDLKGYHPNAGNFGYLDAVIGAIGDSYRRGWSMERALRENGFQGVGADAVREARAFASDLLAMPTEYFEAKPRRVVGIHEFKAAVVPESTSQAALDVLKKHGLEVSTYPRDNPEARRVAVADAARRNDVLFQSPVPGPLWHSTLENAALAAKQAKGTPESWLAVLSKSPGVKAEEIEETGVKEWLGQQKGTVTREQVADFLKQHRVTLEERILGENARVTPQDIADAADAVRRAEDYRDGLDRADFPSHAAFEDAQEQAIDEVRQAQIDEVRLTELHEESGGTHYESYTVGVHKPGTYRELLLTSPAAKDYSAPHFVNDGEGLIAHARIGETTDAQGRKVLMVEEIQSDLHQQGRSAGYIDQREITDLQDRYAAANRRVQEWLNEGDHAFEVGRVNGADWRAKSIHGTLGPPFDTREQAIAWARNTDHDEFRHSNGTVSANDLERLGAPKEVVDAALEARRLDGNLGEIHRGNKIPDVPWKDTWEDLMVRRLIRYAAEHGFERIALTPGAVHTARYGTEEIAWEKARPVTPKSITIEHDDGTRWIALDEGRELEMDFPDGTPEAEIRRVMAEALNAKAAWHIVATNQRGGDAGGVNIEAEARRRDLLSDFNEKITTKGRLRNVLSKIGKENLTDKLWDRMQKEDSGISRPRAEGFEQAYDKRLKGAFDKQLKKYGAKMGMEAVAPEKHAAGPDGEAVISAARDVWDKAASANEAHVVDAKDKWNAAHPDGPFWSMMRESPEWRAEANRLAAVAEEAHGALMALKEPHAVPAHVSDLPPELAQKVLAEGQPLFQPPLPGAVAVAGQERGSIIIGAKTETGRAFTINLNNPDQSTLAHEVWHGLSVMLADLAHGKDAPAELTALHDRLAKEIGYTSGEERAAKLDPAKEEGGASAFEQYLFEGKAPTPALEGVFARFKEWLGRIYGQVRAGLTNEMRLVFDNIFGKPQETPKRQRSPALKAAGAKAKEARDLDDALAAFAADRISKLSLGELTQKRVTETQKAKFHASRMQTLARTVEAGIAGDEGAKKAAVVAEQAVSEIQMQHLVSEHLARAAAKAEAEETKIRNGVSALMTDKARAPLVLAGPEYVGGFDAIMEGLGGPAVGVAPGEAPFSFDTATARIETDYGEVGFNADAIKAFIAKPKPWDKLTLDEARNIGKALTNLRTAANNALRVIRAEGTATIADLNQRMHEFMVNRPKAEKPPPSSASVRETSIVSGGMAELTMPKRILYELGPVGEEFWSDYVDAINKEDGIQREVGERLLLALKAMPAEVARTRYDAVTGPTGTPLRDGAWVRQDLMMMFAWMGNESNTARLVHGLGLADPVARTRGLSDSDYRAAQTAAFNDGEAQLHRLIDQLTKAEKDFVQTAVWDVNDQELKPRLAERFTAKTGLPFPEITAKPITTKDGEYRGGFLHAAANRTASIMAGRGTSAGNFYGDLKSGFPRVEQGFLKQRAEATSYVPDLNWSAYPSHVNAVTHYLGVDPFISNFGRFLQNREVRQTIAQNLGIEKLKQLDEFATVVARGKVEAPGSGARTLENVVLGGFRGLMARAAFAANLPVVIGQLSHLGVAEATIKANPIDFGIGLAHAFMPWTWAEAFDRSRRLGLRWTSYTADTRALLANIGPGQTGLLESAVSKVLPRGAAETFIHRTDQIGHFVDVAGHALYRVMDGFLSMATWRMAEAKALRDGATLERAARIADSAVEDVMPPMNLAENSSMSRSRNIGAILLVRRFNNTLLNIDQMQKFKADTKVWNSSPGMAKVGAYAGGRAERVAVYLGLTLSAGLIARYLQGHGRRDNETRAQWLARQGLIGLFSPYPLAEEIMANPVEKLVNGKPMTRDPFRAAPALAVLQDEMRNAMEAFDRNRPVEDRVFAGSEVLMRMRGIPVAPVRQTKGAIEIGKGHTRGVRDATDKFIYGPSRPHRESNPFSKGDLSHR